MVNIRGSRYPRSETNLYFYTLEDKTYDTLTAFLSWKYNIYVVQHRCVVKCTVKQPEGYEHFTQEEEQRYSEVSLCKKQTQKCAESIVGI